MTSSGLPLFVACIHILVKASIVCREQLEIILLKHFSQSQHLTCHVFQLVSKHSDKHSAEIQKSDFLIE